MWCSICGVSASKVRLFDMVGQKEIVKVCEDCASRENMPIIKRATEFQIKQSERRPSMQERITGSPMQIQREDVKKTNTSLKQVVDRNYIRTLPKVRTPRMDLVPNFYWNIMRVRRSRKITQEQMAKALGVPEAAVRLAEQGILPEADYVLARKIENFLGIRILKPGVSVEMSSEDKAKNRISGINPAVLGGVNLKIADLQRKEAELFWEDDGEDELKEDAEDEEE